jgi:hypothetical protein
MAAVRRSGWANACSFCDPDYKSRIEEALKGVTNGIYKSLNQAAKEKQVSTACKAAIIEHKRIIKCFQVVLSTLKHRAHGHESLKRSAQKMQVLSPEQEQALVDWVHQKVAEGNPFLLKTLCYQGGTISGKSLGKTWAKSFLKRHPEMVLAKPQKLDPKRADHFNKAVVTDFFEKWQALLDEHSGIPPEHIWNMDKKGIQLGGSRKNCGKKFIYFQNSKERYQISSDNLELVTILECISAAGGEIPPSFVLTDGGVPDLRNLDVNSWER